MSKMLGREMDAIRRAQLLNMTLHPGYQVLREMMDEACYEYTKDVIKLNPEEENYREKVANRQMMARCVNDFCASLIKSIGAHNEVGGAERASEESMKTVLNQIDSLRSKEIQ